MFKIGLDLGYGYSKAINDLNKAIKIPSIISLSMNDDSIEAMNDIFNNKKITPDMDIMKAAEDLKISISNGREGQTFYVGVSAQEKSNASFLLDDNKVDSVETKVLTAASSILLFPEEDVPVYLITGLPISQYKLQKDVLKQMFENYKCIVSIPKLNITKTIKFKNVDVVPQGIGAVYYSVWQDINKYTIPDTYIGLIDWGYKTIDYVVFYIDSNGIPKPVIEYSDSINNGMYQIANDINKVFRGKTGNTLEIGLLNKLVSTGKTWYGGDWIDVNKELLQIKEDRAGKVKHTIRGRWADIMPRMSSIFIGGGGGIEMFELLKDFSKNTHLIKDAQMANPRGFKLIGEIKEKLYTH